MRCLARQIDGTAAAAASAGGGCGDDDGDGANVVCCVCVSLSVYCVLCSKCFFLDFFSGAIKKPMR